jgi:predicted transposase YbfD/YdcC
MFTSLIEKFKTVKDFRRNQGKRHPLSIVLTIIIISMLCGNITMKEIEQFSKENEQKLIKLLKIKSLKLPSYSTIRRVMMGVNNSEIQVMLDQWSQTIYQNKKGLDFLAIDGKSLKNTVKNYSNSKQNMLTVVSCFSQETNLVINTANFETQKSSEIKQVQAMISNCGLRNKVFTLDALHCNKDTTRAIIASKNNYLISVKKNQIKLFNKLKELEEKEKPLSVYESQDLSHGRKIMRKIEVFDGSLIQHKSYPHIASFIKVSRSGKRGQKNYQQTLYYVSSLLLSAEIFAKRIKGHWLIENRLHWVKDVIYSEDKLKIKDFQAVNNFSSLITIVLNFYRILGFISIKTGQYWLRKNWTKIFILDSEFG